MRHGNAAVRPDGAGDDDLAALGQVALLVARGQQRQEGRDTEVDGADINTEGLVEGLRADVPELLLVFREWRGSRGLDDGARDAGIGNQEVDVAHLSGDLRDDAFQVLLGTCVPLNRNDVAVFLPVLSALGRRNCSDDAEIWLHQN